MIKNYFKIAWRNLVKYKFFSLVNILGLFAGILFALLIGAYVFGELQVNKKLRNNNKQYILTSLWKDPNMGYELATLGALAKRLKEDYPSLVKNYYRFDGITSIISKGDKHFRENIQLGDSSLLTMYGFKLLYGDAGTALKNSFSVIITKDKAIKYFGKTNVVGETITIASFKGDKHDFEVAGVLDDVIENSVTKLNAANDNTFFIPINAFTFFGRYNPDAWDNIQMASYVELQDGVTAEKIKDPILQLLKKNTSENVQKNLTVRPTLLTDYYLQKDNGLVQRMLYTLSFIGIFILLMAIVNFINISISSSGNRMKEIGVRKVLGSIRSQLIFQFLTESFILVFISTVLALSVYPYVKPAFENIIGKDIPALSSFPYSFIFIPLILVLLIGLLSGLYPALVLSSIKTVNSLKGKLKTSKGNILLRKSLVGFQFSIALIVLIAAVIVTQQVTHFFSQSLGYNKEFIISSQVPRDWSRQGERKMETIRNEFAAMPQIINATLSYEIPNGNNIDQPPVYKFGTDSTKAIAMQQLVADENYISTYQIAIKEGLFFNDQNLDSGKVVMNEKAINALGYKNAKEAIGQQVRIPRDPTVFTIKGVVNDFHFGSMQQQIAPMILFNVRYFPVYRFLSFKIKPGNISASINAVQKKWASLMPGSSFEYNFMDETLSKLYATELQLKKAAYAATLLSLIIVLLGVLGLISLSIQKRVKEIGIRKVLGASIANIILLFVKEFVSIILVAALVACPVAYMVMNNWLNNYAYHIGISIQPFALSIVVLGLVTLLVIGLQTIKAAITNPVKSLRTE